MKDNRQKKKSGKMIKSGGCRLLKAVAAFATFVCVKSRTRPLLPEQAARVTGPKVAMHATARIEGGRASWTEGGRTHHGPKLRSRITDRRWLGTPRAEVLRCWAEAGEVSDLGRSPGSCETKHLGTSNEDHMK
jgi:hypothetical protein